jgi:hypothetical protein
MNSMHGKTRPWWPSLVGILLGTFALGSSPTAPTTAMDGISLVFRPDKPVYAPGEPVVVGVMGLPFTLTYIGMDTDPGPTLFPFGLLNLGFSPELVYHVGITNENGCLHCDCEIDCGSPLLGRPLHFQGVQFPSGSPALISGPKTAMWSDPGGVCAFLDLCPGGGQKPQVLLMTYTGDDCSASSHHQAAGSVYCSGDPADAALVHVLARDPAGKYVWFEDDVPLGGSFAVDAANAGRTQLQGDTVIELFDVASGLPLQLVQFHTSCSQPLVAGDQYGGVRLDGLVLAPQK